MLRITKEKTAESLTFKLEGRLTGPWVDELRQCWTGLSENEKQSPVRVDLNGLTFIDDAGRELLAEMKGDGAEFMCASCWMKALVAEMTHALTRAGKRFLGKKAHTN